MEQPPFETHRIDALVFDVIGTLVDEEPAWQAWLEHLPVQR